MENGFIRRAAGVVAFLALVAILSTGVFRYGYEQALGQLAKRGEADLALAVDRLGAQLQRYREMAVLLADHPVLVGLHRMGGEADTQKNAPESTQESTQENTLDDIGDDIHAGTGVGTNIEGDALLLAAADKTAALNLLYVDGAGRILARANDAGVIGALDGTESGTEADIGAGGIDLADIVARPWFMRAMQGALGAGHGAVHTSEGTKRAYVFAAPTFSRAGDVIGALIVVVDIDNVEWEWRGSRPAVFFTDAHGDVFISNRSELLFWRQSAEQAGIWPQSGERPEFGAHEIAGHDIWQMEWGAYIPRTALYLHKELPVIGLTGAALIDTAPARRLAILQAVAVAALCLAFGALLFLATERRRTLAAANQQLEARVAQRTGALSGANLQLRREIGERQEAEAALKKAQDDLIQAGKLSALGQMSAGISHELNQPLMAIRQYAENGMLFLDRGKSDEAGENLGRIAHLSARMARIIKNLRAFARQESEPMGRVDIGSVISAALELTGARLRGDGVVVVWDAPMGAVYVRGGDVRLGQVMVNLISNAADAMVGVAGDTETEAGMDTDMNTGMNTGPAIGARNERRLEISIEGDGIGAGGTDAHTHADTGRVRVLVRDTGPGIVDPEKIFEPFYSTKEVGAGESMGLGLSISYGLVQSFGGNIRGANASQGGAVFSVELEPWHEETL